MSTVWPVGVRMARREDEDELFHFLQVAHQDNAFFQFVPEKVIQHIRAGTRGKGGMIAVIGDGRIEASIGLVMASYWYTDDVHIEDLWNYVHPEFRVTGAGGSEPGKLGHARRLLQVGMWFSDKLSTEMGKRVPFFAGVMTRKRLEGKIRLYRREMPMIGAAFAYGVDFGDRVDILTGAERSAAADMTGTV